jgi:hypothetical protein
MRAGVVLCQLQRFIMSCAVAAHAHAVSRIECSVVHGSGKLSQYLSLSHTAVVRHKLVYALICAHLLYNVFSHSRYQSTCRRLLSQAHQQQQQLQLRAVKPHHQQQKQQEAVKQQQLKRQKLKRQELTLSCVLPLTALLTHSQLSLRTLNQ